MPLAHPINFYLRLRRRVREWVKAGGRNHRYGEYILTAPDLFHLLVKLALDKNVQSAEKAKLAFVIAYFISPMELLPEALFGPLGFLDDVAAAAYVVNGLIQNTNPEVVRRHWAGEEDVLALVERIVGRADKILGRGLWRRLRWLLSRV